MKILLAVPPSPNHRRIIRMIDCSHEAKASYLWHPNDFLIISSLCGPGDECVLVEGTADSLSDEAFFGRVKDAKPDIIFFALSSAGWETDLKYYRKTRGLYPHTPHFVIADLFIEKEYREFILRECEGIVGNPYLLDLKAMSAAKRGHGDKFPGVYTHHEDTIYKGKQAVHLRTASPRHELFLRPGYRFPFALRHKFASVTTMWGCPFTCSYCTDSKLQPVVRHHEDILAELDRLHRIGVKELFFTDKTFGFSESDVYPLLEAMAKKYRFDWCCYFHPQLYRPKLLEMMKAAGCHSMIVGIDSANMDSLKQYSRSLAKSRLEEFLAKANELRISICADFIIGLPHETEDDVKRTIDYALSLPLDFASFNIAAPLPGSEIRAKAKEKNLLPFGNEGFDTLGTNAMLGNQNLHADSLRRLRHDAILSFYLRPSYILRRLGRTRSPGHFWNQFLQMLALFRKGIDPNLPPA